MAARECWWRCHTLNPPEKDGLRIRSPGRGRMGGAVYIVSESTREWGQGVRGDATELRTHAAQLMERGVTLMARMAQYAPPPPEEIRKAESEMLALFKGDTGPRMSPASTTEPSLHAEEDR